MPNSFLMHGRDFWEDNTKKLLCSWHVDRSWRRSLHDLVHVENERVEIYRNLRTLLEANNTSEFQLLLQHFITWLHNKSYDDFCNYFQLHYCKRVEEWAFCHRVGTPFNTNMFIEAFHRLLKVVYLDNKHNGRIDSLLNTLLRIA